LWAETQTVQLDAQGHYTVFLGAASTSGLPLDIFTTGAGPWLESSRRCRERASSPERCWWAFQAADAETLGGKPASAYVTTDRLSATGTALPASAASTSMGVQDRAAANGRERKQTSGPNPSTTCSSITADGTATANFLSKFSSACVIHQSAIF